MFYSWRDVERIEVLNLLKQVYNLFLSEPRWIDWPLATDANNQEVNPENPDAHYFSLMGACDKFSVLAHPKPHSDFVSSAAREFLSDLSDDKLWKEEAHYKDEFALLTLAIEQLEEEENNVKHS